METIDLTIPQTVQSFRVTSLHLNFDSAQIFIELKSSGGTHVFSYNGEEATTLMIALNKANLSIKSLHRRIIEKLMADGKITGTVSGQPD